MPERNAIYFLSDMHLGAKYIADTHAAERRLCAFLDSIRHDAKAIYLVGDVLDYWYEYRYTVPRGFTRFFGKLAELSDSGIEITWMIGNHDIWIFDYLPSELGIKVVDGHIDVTIDHTRFYITHGDGIGMSRTKMRLLRALFRNPLANKMFAAVHPRWTVPLAYTWSNHSRTSPDQIDGGKYVLDNDLLPFAKEYYATHPDINYFIFGHAHRLTDIPLSPTCRMIVLGDWITLMSYARFSDGKLTLHRYDPQQVDHGDAN